MVKVDELVLVGPGVKETYRFHGIFESVELAREYIEKELEKLPNYGFNPFRIIPILSTIAGDVE